MYHINALNKPEVLLFKTHRTELYKYGGKCLHKIFVSAFWITRRTLPDQGSLC